MYYSVAHCAVRTTEATDDVSTNRANSVWAQNHGEVIPVTHTSCTASQSDWSTGTKSSLHSITVKRSDCMTVEILFVETAEL